MFTIEPPSKIDKARFLLTSGVSKVLGVFGYTQRQLIVCGFPRSGTSLLYNMMSCTTKTQFNFTEFEKYFIHYSHKLGNFATKAPLDVLHLEFIDYLNIHRKRSVVLILVRDIREVLTSRHPIIPNEYFIGYDHSWWPQDGGFDRWKYDAPGVIEVNLAIQNALKRDDVCLVKYEDLVSAPDLVQDIIRNKFDIEFFSRFSQYHLNSDKMAYSYTGRYKAKDRRLVLEGKEVKNKKIRWRDPEHKERIIDQFTKCEELFDILIEYGYEKDRSWFASFRK